MTSLRSQRGWVAELGLETRSFFIYFCCLGPDFVPWTRVHVLGTCLLPSALPATLCYCVILATSIGQCGSAVSDTIRLSLPQHLYLGHPPRPPLSQCLPRGVSHTDQNCRWQNSRLPSGVGT